MHHGTILNAVIVADVKIVQVTLTPDWRCSMKKWLKILALTWLFCGVVIGQTFDVTLSWDANSEADLLGYKVYYGVGPRAYTQVFVVGDRTDYVVENLYEGLWFFSVTAYDTVWNESDYSNEVSINLNDIIVDPPDTVITVEESGLRLYQNYPNPFSTSTVIKFTIDEPLHVDFGIYNIRGKQILRFSDDMKSGTYTTVFDGHNLAPGIYIVRMQTKKSIFSKKMTKL